MELQRLTQSIELKSIITNPSNSLALISKIERTLCVKDTLKCVPIAQQIQIYGRGDICTLLDLQLIKLAKMMNVKHNLTDDMISTIVNDLVDLFPLESLEDWIIVFKRMRQGYYGESYHLLNEATIISCMKLHLEEKAMIREVELKADRAKRLEDEKQAHENMLLAYEKFKSGEIQPISRKQVHWSEDEEYKRYKANFIKNKLQNERDNRPTNDSE